MGWIFILLNIMTTLAIIYFILVHIPDKIKELSEKQALHFKEINIRLTRIEQMIKEKDNQKGEDLWLILNLH